MSLLADKLMGMDRGGRRPEGVGGIPRLTVPGRRGWRPAMVLVIVGSIVITLGTAFTMFRPRNVTSSISRVPAPVVSVPAVPPVATNERFLATVRQGLEAAREGNLPQAAGLLRRALEQKPTDADVWNNLGVVLVRQGESSRGIDAFRQALRFKPNHAEAHRNLAVVLDRQGRTRDAVAHYRAFLGSSVDGETGREDVLRRLAEVSGSGPSAKEPK